MISDVQLAQMAQAVYLNLSYLESVSNTKLLAESSIKYPLVEFAERRMKAKKIELEYPHPSYERRRCDLMIEDSYDKNVFEFKYIRDVTHNEFQDYFDDFLRLHNLHELGYKSYFVVCGNSLLFNKEFRNTKTVSKVLGTSKGRPSGVFSKCLSFSVKKKCKYIDTSKFDRNYNVFTSDYKLRAAGAVHPIRQSFETRLVFLKYGDAPQSIGIWEIL